MGNVSLQKIINTVLDEAPKNMPVDDLEKDKRNLYRKFSKLMEKLGADKAAAKNGGRNYEFKETDVPFIKAILSQIHSNQGIIAKFVNQKKRNERFSSTEVETLIDSLLYEAKKDGADDNELEKMEKFFTHIFCLAPLRSIERCHLFIDMLAGNLQDMTYTQQAIYLKGIEALLVKEVALRKVEQVKNCSNIAETIVNQSDDEALLLYNRLSPEIRYEYMERDRAVLESIQEDDDLRAYIEKKFGIKAEQIFGHITSESN